MKALIVHSRRTGLGILRSLAKHGCTIYTADTFKAPGFFSRYTKKGFIIPNMLKEGEQALLDALIGFGKAHSKDEKIALFTGSDDYLICFSKNWSQLQQYYLPTFETNYTILQSCLEKGRMYHIAQQAGVPYPATYYNLSDATTVDTFPVIIKPSVKKNDKVDVVKEAFRIKRCNTPAELDTAIKQLQKLAVEYVVQTYIPGGDDTLFTAGIYSYQGKLAAIGYGRKIRQFPPQLGECALGELLDLPELRTYAEKLCQVSGVTGIAQIEFKKYKGTYYLMEINPRPWSWVSLMTYAGVNLPLFAYQGSIGKTPDTLVTPERTQGTWMYLTRDFSHNVIQNKNISTFKFIKDFINASQCANWSISDPLPFFVDWYYFLKYG